MQTVCCDDAPGPRSGGRRLKLEQRWSRLSSPQKPIILIPRRLIAESASLISIYEEEIKTNSQIRHRLKSQHPAPDNPNLGVMPPPYAPVHMLLFDYQTMSQSDVLVLFEIHLELRYAHER